MAKKVNKTLTHEEIQEQNLKSQMSMLETEIPFIPEPLQLFSVGEEVNFRKAKDARIKDVLLDGKLYIVSYTETFKKKYTEDIIEKPNTLTYVKWFDLSKVDTKVNENKFTKKDDLRIHFKQMSIQSLFTKVYSFGVDFEPEYQRGYVWSSEDKVALLDSIFNNIEIGKFAFIDNSDTKWKETGLSYEILDGKQRLSTLCEFREGKFEYNGFKFNQLYPLDRAHILNFPVSIAEIRDATEQDVLKYFVKLNSNGKVMSEDHLSKVKSLIKGE